MDKDIEYVEKGYKLVAQKYRDQKESDQAEVQIFQKWLHHPVNTGKIMELGCGSGYPIGNAILSSNHQYIGIDLSGEQINLAKKEFPHWKESFLKAEMVSFCKNSPSNHYTGIISLFSIRHLPRIYHVELFSHIHRILIDNGIFLVDIPHNSGDQRSTWFDGNPMYWSSFSYEWTVLTLKEIGFKLLDSFEYIKWFHGVEEHTPFHLYQKCSESE